MSDLAALRAEFPVLERVAYLNTGTNGPVPRRAVSAAVDELRAQAKEGRGDRSFFYERLMPLAASLRERVAALLGCTADEVAHTGSTTAGVNTVLSGLDLGPGDEVLTSDEEHPGLLAPLAAGRARRGFEVRVVPFEAIAGEVGARTKLVACSHVSWMTGRVVAAATLADADAPVLLDGAQGLGAVPVDVTALGCDFYAASGQKWLCGPIGTGYLYVAPPRMAELVPPWPGYPSLAAPARPLDLELHASAARFDTAVLSPNDAAWALGSLDTLEGPGLDALLERSSSLARRFADLLAERGLEVAPRGPSTLVCWRSADPEGETARLAGEGVIVRFLPETPWVRASVGAWTSEEEIGRLATLAR